MDELLRPAGPPLRAGFLAAVPPLALRLVMEDAEEGFFLGTRRFPLRGFSLPMTVSTNEVTALVAVSFVAAMFILAASAIASGTDEITPSFFLSIAISLPAPGFWPKRTRTPPLLRLLDHVRRGLLAFDSTAFDSTRIL